MGSCPATTKLFTIKNLLTLGLRHQFVNCEIGILCTRFRCKRVQGPAIDHAATAALFLFGYPWPASGTVALGSPAVPSRRLGYCICVANLSTLAHLSPLVSIGFLTATGHVQ